VVVPDGYGQALLAGIPHPLSVVVDPGSSGGQSAQSEVQAAVNRLAGSAEAALLAAQALENRVETGAGAVTGWAGSEDRQRFLEASLERALQGWREAAISA
jgi:hypothetical protein